MLDLRLLESARGTNAPLSSTGRIVSPRSREPATPGESEPTESKYGEIPRDPLELAIAMRKHGERMRNLSVEIVRRYPEQAIRWRIQHLKSAGVEHSELIEVIEKLHGPAARDYLAELDATGEQSASSTTAVPGTLSNP